MRVINFCGTGLVLLFAVLWSGPAEAQVEASVVRIVNQANRFDWYTPWNSGSTGTGTGSGFVISKKRIMTNAHVVSDSALLLVYFHNDPRPYPARVLAIGHDCDLAMLELEDPARLDGVPALEFDGLPALRSQVTTYGYPTGGQLISSTVGVVSRIEQQTYVHSGTSYFLAVQTDAAINPGNSGGPVIQNGNVVGVAFQGNQQLENMGFFIPIQVVDHFLQDLDDGTYDGFPYLGLIAANLKNPAARAYAGMTEEESGIRVENIFSGSSVENVLKLDDIITSIDGYAVANDGSVDWNGLRLNSTFLFNLKQMGETMAMNIIRGDERLSVEIKLSHYNPLAIQSHAYDQKPKYLVYAGLVFAPLNRETLKTYAKGWFTEAPQELIYQLYYKPLIDHARVDEPRVVLTRRLDHEVNAEESNYPYRMVEKVNGKKIQTLEDLAAAFENNQAEFHVIEYETINRITVLNREKANAAHQEILDMYAIPKDRRL